MLLEKLTVVKDPGGIGHVRNRIDSVFRNEFQRFINFFICIFDRIQSLIIGNIHQHIRINKIGKVNIASDSDDIRIVLTDKSCLQHSHSIVWGFDGKMDIIMSGIEFFFQFFKGLDRFRFILHKFDLCLSAVLFTCAASAQCNGSCHGKGKSHTEDPFTSVAHLVILLPFPFI